jgi:hypothetical protein
MREAANAFGAWNGVGVDDLLEGPAADGAHRDQHQLGVGYERALLFGSEPRDAGVIVGGRARQLVEFDMRDATDVFQPLRREVAAGKHPLDAGFAQSQLGRDLGVGHPLRLQQALQRFDETDGLRRGCVVVLPVLRPMETRLSHLALEPNAR